MQSTTEPQQKLLTVREAAAVLAISERTLWNLTNRGDLPRVCIGRSVRYDPTDLVEWIDQQKSNSTPAGD